MTIQDKTLKTGRHKMDFFRAVVKWIEVLYKKIFFRTLHVVVFSAQQFDLINPYVWVSFVKKSEVLVTEQAIDVETSDPKS